MTGGGWKGRGSPCKSLDTAWSSSVAGGTCSPSSRLRSTRCRACLRACPAPGTGSAPCQRTNQPTTAGRGASRSSTATQQAKTPKTKNKTKNTHNTTRKKKRKKRPRARASKGKAEYYDSVIFIFHSFSFVSSTAGGESSQPSRSAADTNKSKHANIRAVRRTRSLVGALPNLSCDPANTYLVCTPHLLDGRFHSKRLPLFLPAHAFYISTKK